MRYRKPTWMCALLVGALGVSPAVAQEKSPSPQIKQEVKALADQALEFYNAGRYQEALKAFRDAEGRWHAPTFLIMIARSYDKLGRLIEARTVYQPLVDEVLAKDAPRAFVQAQAEAREQLAALTPRIPTIAVTVTGMAPGEVQLTLDGVAIPASVPVAQDPGSHVLVGRSRGRAGVSTVISLREGAKERIEIALPPIAVLATPSSLGPGERSPQQVGPGPAEVRSRRSTAVVIGGIAGTVVAGGLGVGFAVAANAKADNLESMAQQHGCRDKASGCNTFIGTQTELKSFNSLGQEKAVFTNVSFWSFVTAGGLAAGTVVYVLLTPEPQQGGAAVGGLSLSAGPGGIVVTRRW